MDPFQILASNRQEFRGSGSRFLEDVMGINLSVKDVPESLAQRLRERAERNHRSLQGELMSILTQAARAEPGAYAPQGIASPSADSLDGQADGLNHASAPRSWMEGWKTVEYLAAERRAAAWQPDPSLASVPLAVDIIRADRDSR
jgi:plasmid stability protein